MTVEGEVVGSISHGLCVFLGVETQDGPAASDAMAAKLARLRIFEDAGGKMNRSVADLGGAILVVSQFTLAADTSRGNRPSFVHAAPPERAEPLYQRVVDLLATEHRLPVATGRFRATMKVAITNSGPVTIILRVGPDGSSVS